METQAPAIVQLRKMTKAFSGVTVLRDVDFDIYPGEIHAIIGENGAGKSTLVKIIGGVLNPTHGEIFINGNIVNIPNPLAARKLGIALMHQEPLTFPELDVTENIFVGNTRDGKPFVDWRKKRKLARELLDSLEMDIKETDIVKGMSIAGQQMVEIICALSINAKIIIMDEPTAALTLDEVNKLFNIIRRLKAQGKAIIFIGHRLEEIEIIADRITVLRDGNKVCERLAKNTSRDMMIKFMIGRNLSEQIIKEKISIGETLLKVENLTLPGKFENVSFEIKRGEIIGMGGLIGSGRTEVASAIFGLTPPKSGRIFIKGKEEKINNPLEAISKGIAMVPEDRAVAGLFMTFTVKHNMTFASLGKIAKLTWLNFKKEDILVKNFIKNLSIMLRDTNQEVRELSGGNQQKIVLSKWLMTQPEIFLLDEPTRGIDVGAKAEVYKLINNLAKEGKAILLISSEMEEIIQLSDRVYVMCEGKIAASLGKEELSEEVIMTAAATTKKREAQST